MLSVVIPVFNEEEILRENFIKLNSFMKKNFKKYEIIICDNGSTDGTKEIGLKLAKKYNTLHFFSIKKRGVGLAFKEMVKRAKYDKIISLDMDLSVDMKFILKSKLLDNCDIVIGSKKAGKQKRPVIRKFLSAGFIFLVGAFLGLTYKDYSIGAKMYRKSVIEKYIDEIDTGSSYVINIIFYAKRDGYKIKEVPVICNDKRKSKFKLINEIVYRFKGLVFLFLRTRK